MKKIMISICIFVLTTFIYATEKHFLTKASVNEYWKDISFWDSGISSKLIEHGYNHSWESIKDNNLSTAWVEGKDGDGIGEISSRDEKLTQIMGKTIKNKLKSTNKERCMIKKNKIIVVIKE